MARIILVYDSFPLKFAVLGVLGLCHQGQVECGNVQTAQYLGHFIFIKRFNAELRRGKRTIVFPSILQRLVIFYSSD